MRVSFPEAASGLDFQWLNLLAVPLEKSLGESIDFDTVGRCSGRSGDNQ
jgi:hypothetical protein